MAYRSVIRHARPQKLSGSPAPFVGATTPTTASEEHPVEVVLLDHPADPQVHHEASAVVGSGPLDLTRADNDVIEDGGRGRRSCMR